MSIRKGEATLTELLFERSTDFIGIYDIAAERFVRVNKAGVHILGFKSEDEFLNDPTLSKSIRINQLTDQQRADLLDRINQHGRHEEIAELRRVTGESFWVQLKIDTFNEAGYLFVVASMLDRERLKRAELELQQSVQRYEAVFANATIGIVVSNQSGQVVSLNQMAGQLFGYTDTELVGQSIDLLVPMSVAHNHAKLRASFIDNPQVRSMGHNRDLHARRKDGSVFPVEVSLSYFRLDDELYVVAYIIDITFKKEAERQLLDHRDHIERLNANLEQKVADRTHALMNTLDQLEQSKDELARALAAERELGELKSRFVSMASHEFRTPLTAVLTSATLIEKYPGSDQQEKRLKHLNRIRASVNHLNDILEEFLSVGRLEEGRVDIHPAFVDLAKLIDETVVDMQGLLKAAQTIQVNLACTDLVRLDPSLLRKILVNLLSNAVKYSGAGSVVIINGQCAGGLLTVSVVDEGVGIAPDDQEHLFERFFRAKNVANIAGTGLGLHIVARYVDLMGGQVALQSELNKGTTVTLTLPYENNTAD